MNVRQGFAFACLLAAMVGCKDSSTSYLNAQLQGIDQPIPPVSYPELNPFSASSIALGKLLFNDQRLSSDNTISCASCHDRSLGFATNLPANPGVEQRPGTRNSPSLGNVAFQPYFMREGSVPTLEAQILVPIQEHNEFDSNILEIVAELEGDETYQSLSQAAYDQPLSAFTLTRSIANFERTLVSNQSRWDAFIGGEEFELTDEELDGLRIFTSERANCISCHNGFNFTNYEIVNNGLYEVFQDEGLANLTLRPEDEGKFKVPSLRNVSLTAPYMHDGSLANLYEVIAHYEQGGQQHPNQDARIKPFELTFSERDNLVAFLSTLEDDSFGQGE
ncbi:MAG: cytochrome c peroxidase [Flavobacteriales bacterium]|nr:cytochrome c peroxidase [Flavobacteriales bacterium]MDG1780432.1 cytochrome c peroxidase [Flavobacteriales bacterium]